MAVIDEAKGATRSVGTVTADLVRQYGAQHYFGLTGGDNLFLLALRDQSIDVVLARSERAAAFMADAYARLTAKPTFVYGQFGPGAMVVLSGLIDALYGRSPVIALTSEAHRGRVNRFGYQELDQVAHFRPAVKWAGRVEIGSRLPDLLRTAVREAVSGIPGPAYLGVPTDLLLEPFDGGEVYADAHFMTAPAFRPAADPQEVANVAAAIQQASRPIILAGTGVMSSRAWAELTALADAHSIPVVTSTGGKGAIAETHRLAHGVAGRYSRLSANTIMREADLVIAVGSRLGDMTTDAGAVFAPHARLAHIDIDPTSLGRTRFEDFSVVGDAQKAFVALNEALEDSTAPSEWVEWASSITDSWRQTRAEVERRRMTGGINPAAVMAAVRTVLGPEDMVVADTGNMVAWTSALYDLAEPGLRHLRTAGSLGWAVPAALGAQLAIPDRRVVCVTGDGGIGYHVGDLETAVRLRLPVVFLLLNNGTLAFEYQNQRIKYQHIDPTLNDFGPTDYAGVARGFGAQGRLVEDPEQLEAALRWALELGEPVLLDVRVDRSAPAPVTNFESFETREI